MWGKPVAATNDGGDSARMGSDVRPHAGHADMAPNNAPGHPANIVRPPPLGGARRCRVRSPRRFSPKFWVETAERTFQQGLWSSGARWGWRVRVRGGGGRRRRRRRSRRRSGATDGATITARGYARGNGRPICFKAIFLRFFLKFPCGHVCGRRAPLSPYRGASPGAAWCPQRGACAGICLSLGPAGPPRLCVFR